MGALSSNDPRLSNLDAAISTRAATADARLANLDAAMSTRAADATVAKPASLMTGIVKSIQRGVIVFPGTTASAATATVTAVGAKYSLYSAGITMPSGAAIDASYCRLSLSGTTVTATRQPNVAVAVNVSFELVEYY
jgi:hypothetical protein